MKRKNKVVILTALVSSIIILVGLYAYTQYKDKQHVEATKSILSNNITIMEKAHFELDSLREEKGYLRKGLTMQEIEHVEKQINSIKTSSSDYNLKKGALKEEIAGVSNSKKLLKEKLATLKSQFSFQVSINALFSQEIPALDGALVNESAVIKNDLNSSTIAELKERVLIEDQELTKWIQTTNELLAEAENQLSQIEISYFKVDNLIQDGKNRNGISREGYDIAKSEVDKIKNIKIKNQLNDKLSEVFTQLNDTSNLSEEEINRKVLALFMQLYEWDSSRNLMNRHQTEGTEISGGIQYYAVTGNAKPLAQYTLSKEGILTFIAIYGREDMFESKTANIFTDVDDDILSNIRKDVTDLESSVLAEIEEFE